jgi:hypothetical protein
MDKITYPDKQTAVNPTSPAANEIFTATNANQIKTIVNAIVDAMEVKVTSVANSTTVPLDQLDLETAYPGAGLGYEVICENVTDGPRTYKKMPSGDWHIIFTQFI